MKISEIVEQSLKDTKNGKVADTCARSVLCNLIKEGEPFQAVELKELHDLEVMMRDADFPHVYGERGVFYFSAYYFHDERYPVGRNYFMRESDLIEVARLHQRFKSNGLDLPLIPPHLLGEKIRLDGLEERIQTFRKQQDEETSMFKGLFEGRSESTSVESSMFLNSSGCLVCGNSDIHMATSTLSTSSGFMLGFKLCDQHMATAKSESNLMAYLASLFDQPFPFEFSTLKANEHFDLVLSWLPKKLGCSVEKVKGNTMTLVRPSGIRVIFRLDSLENYAYMIINLEGKEVARIDSANHHDINYGPDHLHTDLSRKTWAVESSFTTGSPLIDTKKISQLIESKEAELNG